MPATGKVIIRQKPGEHLFEVVEDGKVQGRCDLITAEEVAIALDEAGIAVEWVYPEDFNSYRSMVGLDKKEIYHGGL